jgi:hypothetical protein
LPRRGEPAARCSPLAALPACVPGVQPRVTALMLSVITHLLKSPVARLKPSLLRNLVTGAWCAWLVAHVPGRCVRIVGCAGIGRVDVQAWPGPIPCLPHPPCASLAVLLERVPALEETSSCVEFAALVATAAVRAASAEAGRAGAGAGSSSAFGPTVTRLPAIVACLFNFFEAEQKVRACVSDECECWGSERVGVCGSECVRVCVSVLWVWEPACASPAAAWPPPWQRPPLPSPQNKGP